VAVRAQGATEYLVLLAVVLIVALVSVALLGFFPGMASDAQITQSRAYWQSAGPIAVIDISNAYDRSGPSATNYIYLKFRNSGPYKVAITKLLTDADAANITTNAGVPTQIILSPGEEGCVGSDHMPSSPLDMRCMGYQIEYTNVTTTYFLKVASRCDDRSPGIFIIRNFGFEYIEYVDGQQITKRENGKDLMTKCAQEVVT